MRKAFWIVLLILVVVFVWWYRKDGNDTPDKKLSSHFAALCDVMRDNVDSPSTGVDRVFGYLGENSPAMLEQFGATLVTIERIADDNAHDRRAEEAARRIRAPLIACQGTFERFISAVEDDPAALRKAQRGLERFDRTLQILFGSKGLEANLDQILETLE